MADDPWADFVTSAPQTSNASGDPWADFVQPAAAAPEAPVTASGLYKAVDSGAAAAAASIGGLPRLAANAIQAGGNWASNKLGYGNVISPEPSQLPTSENIAKRIQEMYYGGAAPYEPQNRAERYGQTG